MVDSEAKVSTGIPEINRVEKRSHLKQEHPNRFGCHVYVVALNR